MSKRNRHKQKTKDLMRRENADGTSALPATPNLGFHEASTVVTNEARIVQIIVVGCGGIGAYITQHVARLMRVLYEANRGVNLTLVDPDVVEEKNLGRQLFCDAEVGVSKSLALARRYGQAFGLNTIAYQCEYSESMLLPDVDLHVLIGCVDNHEARKALHETLGRNPERVAPHVMPREWWLDCGNLKDTGRVMLGSAYDAEACEGSFLDKKRVIALPSPALQYPDLLIPERADVGGRPMSCAELQMANLQSLNINAGVAVQAADMLTRLLVAHDLKRFACAVNLASGSVKSSYCTPDEVAGAIGRQGEFVIRKERAFDRPIVGAPVQELASRQVAEGV
jgi:PRTRC genetic system ThiF family protein